MKLYVVIASYNRPSQTIICLQNLIPQLAKVNWSQVVLVDESDSSSLTDHYSDSFPKIVVLKADGTQFWCGSTNIGIKYLFESNTYFDAVLFLNDDVVLEPNAVEKMLDIYHDHCKISGHKICVVGSTVSSNKKSLVTYGGRDKHLRLIQPTSKIQSAFTFNANIVLISKEILVDIGCFSSSYRHRFADYDFGIRAANAGSRILLSPGYLGVCDYHLPSWNEPGHSLLRRIRDFHSPKGVHLSELKAFHKVYRKCNPYWTYFKECFHLLFPHFRNRSYAKKSENSPAL